MPIEVPARATVSMVANRAIRSDEQNDQAAISRALTKTLRLAFRHSGARWY